MEQRVKEIKNYVTSRGFVLVALTAASIIFLGIFFGWYNNKVVPVNTSTTAHYISEPANKFSFTANWDAADYLSIAQHGYTTSGSANFFPLFPLLIHVLNYIISSPLDCALIIAWLSFCGALYFYLKITKILFKENNNLTALRGVLLFALFPTAVFMIAPFTEGIFALLSLGAIYFALRKKYLISATLALLMSATHITGAFVLVLLALILWEQKAKVWQIIASLAIGSLGLLGYMFYLQEKFHKPLAFISAQENHGWLDHGYNNLVASADFFSIVLIGLLVLSAIYWWRKRISFSIYSLLFLLIPLLGKQFGGFDRYVLMAFPIPLMLYGITKKRPNLYTAVIVVSVVAWTYFTLQYMGGYVGG